jgi:hypothetical protein
LLRWTVVGGWTFALALPGCGPRLSDAPAWAEIVFVRSSDDGNTLMTVDRDGSGLASIYATESAMRAPQVSGDGEYLLWVEFDEGERWVGWLAEGRTEAEELEGLDSAVWGPTGATLAGIGDNGMLTVVDVGDGGRTRELVATTDAGALLWSPTGTRIALEDAGAIVVVDVESAVGVVVAESMPDAQISWSPGETALAVGSGGRVFEVDVANRSAELLVESWDDPEAVGPFVAWSPDGEWIAWAGDKRGHSEGVVRPGDPSSEIHAGPAEGTPRWSHDGSRVAFDLDGTVHQVCYHTDGCGAALVYREDLSDEQELFAVRAAQWAPHDAALLVSLAREDFGGPLPRRIAVHDVADGGGSVYGLGYETLGDLEPDDPREDLWPIWRVVPTGTRFPGRRR